MFLIQTLGFCRRVFITRCIVYVYIYVLYTYIRFAVSIGAHAKHALSETTKHVQRRTHTRTHDLVFFVDFSFQAHNTKANERTMKTGEKKPIAIFCFVVVVVFGGLFFFRSFFSLSLSFSFSLQYLVEVRNKNKNNNNSKITFNFYILVLIMFFVFWLFPLQQQQQQQ